jgi:hypothetical protein
MATARFFACGVAFSLSARDNWRETRPCCEDPLRRGAIVAPSLTLQSGLEVQHLVQALPSDLF